MYRIKKGAEGYPLFSGVLIAGLMMAGGSVHAQSLPEGLSWVGLLPGAADSDFIAMSPDGKTFAGIDTAGSLSIPFVWTADAGFQPLDLPLGTTSTWVSDISADGRVVVGFLHDGTNSTATRWVNGTSEALGTLGGDDSFASGVSGNGQVVVGVSEVSGGIDHAFRWTQNGGMVDLGTLGGNFSEATAASHDGSVVVGRAHNGTGGEAFRWTQADGMIGMGVLAGATFSAGDMSSATGVSADGSVIVGYSVNSSTQHEAFRWTEGEGMVGLGMLAGSISSYANAVSADGKVVAGTSSDMTGSYAFRWSDTDGMQSVEEWIASFDPSFALAAGDKLTDAAGVSATGKIMSGYGELGGVIQPWIARAGEEDGSFTGLLGVSDFASSLSDVRAVTATGNSHMASFLGQTLSVGRWWGAGGHLSPEGRIFVSIASEAQIYDRDNLKGSRGSGALSVAYALSPDWRIGLGYSYGVLSVNQKQKSGLKDKTHTRLPHQTVGAFAEYGAALGWQARLATAYGWGDPKIKRSYDNGASKVSSSGETDIDMFGVAVQGGYAFSVSPSFSLEPYAGLSWTRSTMDAYSEKTGTGGFPASFGKRSENEWRGSIGLDGFWQLAPRFGLTGGLAYTRQFGGSADNMEGVIPGLFDFDVPMSSKDDGWVTVNLGTRIGLTQNTTLDLSGSVNVGSANSEPNYAFMGRVTMGF